MWFPLLFNKSINLIVSGTPVALQYWFVDIFILNCLVNAEVGIVNAYFDVHLKPPLDSLNALFFMLLFLQVLLLSL